MTIKLPPPYDLPWSGHHTLERKPPLCLDGRRWHYRCRCGHEWEAKAYNERCPVCRDGFRTHTRLPHLRRID